MGRLGAVDPVPMARPARPSRALAVRAADQRPIIAIGAPSPSKPPWRSAPSRCSWPWPWGRSPPQPVRSAASTPPASSPGWPPAASRSGGARSPAGWLRRAPRSPSAPRATSSSPRSRPSYCIPCRRGSAAAQWPRSNREQHHHEPPPRRRASPRRSAPRATQPPGRPTAAVVRPWQRHRLGGCRRLGAHDRAPGRAAPRGRGDRPAPGRGRRRPGGARGGRGRGRGFPGRVQPGRRGGRGDGRHGHVVPVAGLGRTGRGPRAGRGCAARHRRCRRSGPGRPCPLHRRVRRHSARCGGHTAERTSRRSPGQRPVRRCIDTSHGKRSVDADGRTHPSRHPWGCRAR
jgi:translation initiation factor IF-2